MSGSGATAGAQAITRALVVLEAFGDERPLMSIAEIASVTSITIPTAHRIVNALTMRGFLIREREGKLYGIGPAVARLGKLAQYTQTSFAFLEPLLRAVRDETGETVGLHVRSGRLRVCISEFESLHRVRVTSGIGHTYPMLRGAASKSLLAWMPEDELTALLQALGVSAAELADLGGELESIRHRRYAKSFGETIPGAHAVSAPVLDPAGYPIASVNITAPAARLPRERMRAIGRDLVSRLDALREPADAPVTVA